VNYGFWFKTQHKKSAEFRRFFVLSESLF
jgi:hypothetical protein